MRQSSRQLSKIGLVLKLWVVSCERHSGFGGGGPTGWGRSARQKRMLPLTVTKIPPPRFTVRPKTVCNAGVNGGRTHRAATTMPRTCSRAGCKARRCPLTGATGGHWLCRLLVTDAENAPQLTRGAFCLGVACLGRRSIRGNRLRQGRDVCGHNGRDIEPFHGVRWLD
jgi:hypothetical protein